MGKFPQRHNLSANKTLWPYFAFKVKLLLQLLSVEFIELVVTAVFNFDLIVEFRRMHLFFSLAGVCLSDMVAFSDAVPCLTVYSRILLTIPMQPVYKLIEGSASVQ